MYLEVLPAEGYAKNADQERKIIFRSDLIRITGDNLKNFRRYAVLEHLNNVDALENLVASYFPPNKRGLSLTDIEQAMRQLNPLRLGPKPRPNLSSSSPSSSSPSPSSSSSYLSYSSSKTHSFRMTNLWIIA